MYQAATQALLCAHQGRRRRRRRGDRETPAIRGRRDRIKPPEKAHELLAALPTSEKAFWATALFCGPRRGEPRGLQWLHVDFDAGVIRVERAWDPVKGPIDVKTGAGQRAVPMAFVVRRELQAHKQRTHRDGEDLVFGRTTTEAFFASTIRSRANKAWLEAGLEPITPHEARHCAISYFIAAGLDWKQIPPGPATATSARPGTATAISSPAAKRPPRPGSTRISNPRAPSLSWSRNRIRPQTTATSRRRVKTRLQTEPAIRLWRTLWRTPHKTRNPPYTRGIRSTATGIRTVLRTPKLQCL